jgi:DNA-binding LytR/AlgR family response regulator
MFRRWVHLAEGMPSATLCQGMLHAEDAAQALDVLENNQSHVDVLFTDLRMRDGMSGLELARVAKRKDPDLRVVITSG